MTSSAQSYRAPTVLSRERNRMHARKTRQRKKEHMMHLQARADQLKDEQLQLKQIIDEKNTASILLVMAGFANGPGDPGLPAVAMSAAVEALVRRPNSDIPDSSKISELPEIPPLFGLKRKRNMSDVDSPSTDASTTPADDGAQTQEDFEAFLKAGNFPDDGIDYALLAKDRSRCTTAEIDQIRRERNRMHAKRTRDRKRLYMEEMEKVINQLEEENIVLKDHVGLFSPTGLNNNSKGEMSLGVHIHQQKEQSQSDKVPSPPLAPLNDKNCENDILLGKSFRVTSPNSIENRTVYDKHDISEIGGANDDIHSRSPFPGCNIRNGFSSKRQRMNGGTASQQQVVRMSVLA
mmetsp:Transcript_35439/g.82196  ORF Transcript_35439/g.82196 Transcript_35439/m.82196 type:complete len:349 (-) Transcript_35439:428-1474(-)|eukprot:CAMPEP_0113297806 /NCGR_PEP_ID=MMETSP0010_2-20120614/512_1 /TAXON_ID=216773 ORGANISM="Corethron hystrix, Strain 308" /NCGR_SAMPLE_ID=MMETSP0010_2 /ASSEMBLY_ACC=CAM_ASM_000155 /LENGTH=348 /DNA_ID=CAMNT_0000150751 /DNA_START=740 /DNA_END=1786 /DNA_ORIENTATION=- /assembly_acc=CAM_ASM_000155